MVSAAQRSRTISPILRPRTADRLASLWTPVLAFLVAFTAYLIVIGCWPAAARWAFPAIRGFGLACLIAVPAWLAFRRVRPGYARDRHARLDARDVAQLVRGLASDHPELRARAEALLAASTAGTAAMLEPQVEELSSAAHAALPGLQRSAGWQLARALLLALGVAGLFRAVLVEPYRIPTPSMLPTLQVGDQVLVNRFLYGVQVPFTKWVPFPFVRRPARGDVIVFVDPVGGEEDFIKRVVGVPGDTVALVEGRVRVNDVELPLVEVEAGYPARELRSGRWVANEATRYQEELDGVRHDLLLRRAPEDHAPQGPWTVPPGQVFVLGDNRDASSDSRSGFGHRRTVEFVPYGHIKGKAMVIWLSLSYDGILSNLFGGTGLRADRMLMPVR